MPIGKKDKRLRSIKDFFKVENPRVDIPSARNVTSQQEGVRSIKDFFRAENSRSDILSVRNVTSQQEETILLSSSEDDERDQPQKEPVLRKSPRILKEMPAMTNVIASDDSEDDATSGISNFVQLRENSAAKRAEENLWDSQELMPIKRRKFGQNRILDSDDEIFDTREIEKSIENEIGESECSQVQSIHSDKSSENERRESECRQLQSPKSDNSQQWIDSDESEFSSDSFDSDLDDVINTDEIEWMESYKEPDPRFLYDDHGERKKSRKKDASYYENQEVSIHKINLNHYKFSRKSVENIIEYIVDKYNDDRETNRSENKTTYKKIKVQPDCKPVVKSEDEQYFEGDDFRIKVYVQKVAKKIALLSSYGIKEKATTIHSLIFHYRTKELFAITTNQAWNVVQWCSDFEFPGIVAARILSKDGELESTNKGLVGTELTRKTTHKQQKKTNPYNLLTFCTRFTAEIRENASILRLSCFQKKNPVPDVTNGEENDDEVDAPARQPCRKIKGIKMTVSLGNVRILKRFSTSDILSILSFLSTISNGNETLNLDGETEQNSTAHKKYLTAVDTLVANELNVRLSDIIHDAIADDNKLAELDNYQFCHKHSTDFFSGFDFELYYKGLSVKKFTEIPTIRQIVVELRHNLGQIERGTSREGFLKLLNNAKISYRFGSNRKAKKQEKLMNFVDGLLYHSKDNTVFWHVNAMWCHVQDGYLYLVHTQFKNILTNYLLTDTNDPAYLNIGWPKFTQNMNPESKLKNYLEKYSIVNDIWISDRPERDIVDMIKIGKVDPNSAGKNVFFVYYFLPGPNNQTTVKCNRVAQSIMQIGKTNRRMLKTTQSGNDDVAGSEDVRDQLSVVYRKASKKRQFKSACPDFDKFVKMITEAKFFLAVGRETSTSIDDIPSLVTEKEMATEIAIEDIADIFEKIADHNHIDDLKLLKETARSLNQNHRFDKSRCTELAESIHDQLRQNEYIEAQGNSISGKFLSQSKDNFELTNNGNVNRFLYEKIISKFQPRVCTVLSKLGFIDLREEISKLTISSFNLIEIPMLE